MALFYAPTGSFSTVLDIRLSSTDTQMTVRDATKLQAPGVLVLNREDGNGNSTEALTEYISFTGISSNTLTGLGRGLGGYAAKDHNAGSLVESFFSVNHWTQMIDFLRVDHNTNGTAAVTSGVSAITATGVSGASFLQGDVTFVPRGNISLGALSGISEYSAVHITAERKFHRSLVLSIPTSLPTGAQVVGNPFIVPYEMTLKSISGILKSPPSGASLVLDINRNFSSIFTNQATRFRIVGGGTYASTASFPAITLLKGDIITVDVDASA